MPRRAFLTRLPARQWLTVLLGGVVCLALWQVWLTVRLMEQDRNLELQRSRERLGQIADLALAQLSRSLANWDLGLRELNALPPVSSTQARFPPGVTFILISQDGIKIHPQRPLLFTPAPPVERAKTLGAFETADELELREQQYERAIAALRPLTLAPATRPEALLRMARIENKANLREAALDTYRSLARETALSPSGTPYALLAASATCRNLMDLGRRKEASAEAELLRNWLLDGRWPLSREAFEYHWSELDRLGAAAGPPPRSSIDFSVLVGDLYNRWQIAQSRGSSPGGRESQPDSSLLVWNATSDRLSALLAPPDWLNTTLKLPANSGDVQWRLLLPGMAAGGTGLTVTRSLAEAQIPGRLEFLSIRPISGTASNRRTLLLGGAGLMLLVILGSGYVVYSAISRELRVAQLQSDFVAAVSHEFRSPLTTLRTITELLAQNRISDESRRQQSYVFLDHETNRLHRLVEDLLDFGRMESGRKQYRIEPHDAFELVRATVADFSEHAEAQGFSVEADLVRPEGISASTVRVDEEAFRRAVRNLLDNAVKYSPACRTVWVDGAVCDHRVLISVRDQGMGINAEEKQAIFQKFVRGQAAKKAGIKGTGIGLSMVRQISEAMGGEIRVQSEVGVGSTFTLVLPLAED
jgi:signal transduction histidine kinase